MKKTNWAECAIRDIKDYKDGLISKRTLCRYIADDLGITAVTYLEYILISIVNAVLAIVLYKVL